MGPTVTDSEVEGGEPRLRLDTEPQDEVSVADKEDDGLHSIELWSLPTMTRRMVRGKYDTSK